jgi:uncharacterized protein YndB with AHSA1/START domain
MATDRIEREIIIDAPRERVWTVLTQPEHVAKWFGDSAEVDPQPGGKAVFGWSEHGGDHHALVERFEPPGFFSYRWARPAGEPVSPGNSTLVEFTLTDQGSGTRLLVVETGFASLDVSEAERGTAAQENTTGWRKELDELRAYAQRTAG